MKLHPEDLDVTSFETGSESEIDNPTIVTTSDPTPATWCRICPVRSEYCDY